MFFGFISKNNKNIDDLNKNIIKIKKLENIVLFWWLLRVLLIETIFF